MPHYDSTDTERAQLDVNDFKRQAQNIAADLAQLTQAGAGPWNEDRMAQLRAIADSARNLGERIPFFGDTVNLLEPTEGETGVSEEDATINPEGVEAGGGSVMSAREHNVSAEDAAKLQQPTGESEDNSQGPNEGELDNDSNATPGVFPTA